MASSEFDSTTELLEALEDPFDNFHPLESQRFIPYHLSAPTLCVLPREIRDIIYTDLIVAGELRILLTSKAVCQEVTQLLYKQGTCRFILDMTLPYAGQEFALRKFHASAIQNLHIDIRKVYELVIHDYHSSRPFKIFSGSSVCRQNCHINFDPRSISMARHEWPQSWRVRELLDDLRTLMGFKTLTIKKRSCNPRSISKVSNSLQFIKDYLEVSLGEAIWREGTKANQEVKYLEFHPRDHWEACQEGQSSRI